ncbi:MAG: glycoside hydrolase family 88 protein, partial [Candidatus Glassbacteria bacterium]|nr:glycoside hydrolase family 88 protein [Candidatus Glassbacteria bacterium]
MSKHLWLRMKKTLLPAGLALALTGAGCAAPETVDPRIGLIGAAASLQRVDEALTRMGERFELIQEVNPPALAGYELIILNRGAHALNYAGLVDNFNMLLDWVREGGALLVFEIDAAGYRSEFLPYEIVFSDKAAAGKEDWDFVEQVEAPEHPVFNRPHRIDYLRGLEESWRIVRTGPQWRILASKDPRPPSLDPRIEKLDNSAGSIFEAGYGRGAVLVCQPMVARYHAGCVSNEPHYLEAGVLLFENIVEYMKAAAAGTSLPVVSARAVPTTGDAGQSVHLRALPGGDTAEPCTYAWDFGDGAASEEPDPVHVYGKEGVFRPAVRVIDARGRVDRDACRVELGPARPMRWADQLVKAQIHRHYPDPTRRQRDYPTALVLQGMLDVYGRTRNDEILEYVKGFFEPLVRRREHDPESSTFNYGSLMVPAYELYRITGERVYLEMAMKYWKSSIAEIDSQLGPGMFWGLGGRRTIVDLLYFFCNERALYYEVTGEVSALDVAADQLALFTGYLLDPADSLYFQAIDLDRSSYWCSPERPTGLNDSKWGRGNGWVAMAFTELLLRLPPGHPSREMLRGTVLGFFSGLLRAQDPETGLWAQVTDKRDYPGMWLETTSTSMFVYSAARLVEAGLLPAEPFLAMARRGYNGLQQRLKMGAFSYPYLSDACMGTGPMFSLERWLQAQRRSNDRHVVGSFLMAEEALWRAAPPAVAVIGDLSAPESRLGPALNYNGLYFYQIPDLYTTADLDSFSAVIVDRFALDRNAANL